MHTVLIVDQVMFLLLQRVIDGGVKDMRRRMKIYLSHPLCLIHEIEECTEELEEKLHVRIYKPYHDAHTRKRIDIALFDEGKPKPHSVEEKRKSEKIE